MLLQCKGHRVPLSTFILTVNQYQTCDRRHLHLPYLSFKRHFWEMSNERNKSLAVGINLIEKQQDIRFHCKKKSLIFSERPLLPPVLYNIHRQCLGPILLLFCCFGFFHWYPIMYRPAVCFQFYRSLAFNVSELIYIYVMSSMEIV